MALDYEALVRLERRLSLALRDLKEVDRQGDSLCRCPYGECDCGVRNVRRALPLLDAAHTTVGIALLDALRAETRSA